MAITEPTTKPEFAVAVRGYDRAQVDEYLAQLHEWLFEAESRRSSAEEARVAALRQLTEAKGRLTTMEERAGEATPASMATFGDRLGQLLQSAVDAADELRAESKAEAEQQRRSLAEEREALLGRARAEAERIVEAARRQEQEIADHLAELSAKRSAALIDLDRLRRHLGDLLGTPEPAAGPGREDRGAKALPAVAEGAHAARAADRRPADATGATAARGVDGGTGRPAPVGATAAPTLVQPVTGTNRSGDNKRPPRQA